MTATLSETIFAEKQVLFNSLRDQFECRQADLKLVDIDTVRWLRAELRDLFYDKTELGDRYYEEV